MKKEIDDDGNIKLKTILIGQSGVGKTNLINIAREEKFNPSQVTTVNCSFFKKIMNIDNKLFNIYLWDTIGQEKLKSLTKIFFKNAKIVILVYDITNKKSLEELNYWLKEVKESLGENIILGVLGNKKDLFVNEEVTEEQGQEYAKSIGARWGLTSAKTERESFITYVEDLIRDYIKKIEPEEKKEEDNKDNNLVLQNEDTEKKKKKKKCLFF
jgi:small GTP-binding protein